MKFIKKLKLELSYNPAVPLPGMYPKELKGLNICTPILITTLFMIAKRLKQPKYPSVDEQIDKTWYICIVE